MKAKFGPGGNPDSFYEAGFKASTEMPAYLKSVGLDAYEYQCNKGVKISDKTAAVLGNNARENGIALSIHSQYYISLSSVEAEKREKSVEYIMQCLRVAEIMGAKRIVVHSGSASKISRAEALALAADTLKKTLEAARGEGISEDILICPETMGKINQLGDFSEVMELCSADERLMPCIDFGHINSRTFGSLKTEADYEALINEMENKLGSYRAKNFHCHFSKIEYSLKGGEVKHLTFEDDTYGPFFEPLGNIIKKKNLSPVIICESAGTQGIDSLFMKKYTESI